MVCIGAGARHHRQDVAHEERRHVVLPAYQREGEKHRLEAVTQVAVSQHAHATRFSVIAQHARVRPMPHTGTRSLPEGTRQVIGMGEFEQGHLA